MQNTMFKGIRLTFAMEAIAQFTALNPSDEPLPISLIIPDPLNMNMETFVRMATKGQSPLVYIVVGPNYATSFGFFLNQQFPRAVFSIEFTTLKTEKPIIFLGE